MRIVSTATALTLALGLASGAAEARDRPSQVDCVTAGRHDAGCARRDQARRTVRALDDYDAQIARRQRELKAEMRELERKSRGR